MVLLATAKSKKVDHLRERRNNERQYVFDVVFGADSSQEEVYTATTKHLVDNVLAGYNATVFAYGATGGGKTYTMVGTQDNPGIMVRALNHLFRAVAEDSDNSRKVSAEWSDWLTGDCGLFLCCNIIICLDVTTVTVPCHH